MKEMVFKTSLNNTLKAVWTNNLQ